MKKEKKIKMSNKVKISTESFFAKCAKLNVPTDFLLEEQYVKK
jgi:hypothetical protein